MPDPAAEYTRRLGLRSEAFQRWSRWELAVSWSRLGAAVIGVVLAWLAVQNRLFSLGWVVLPAAAFGALVVIHDRVLRLRDGAQRSKAFYEQGLARLEHRWMGQAEDESRGERFDDPRHLYSADLDLFGRGSLFELLSTARTRAGEETLAGWLLRPAQVTEIRERQQAVADLLPRLDLRESMALAGQEARAGLDPQALLSWASAPPVLVSTWGRLAVALLSGLNLLAALGWAALGWGPSPLMVLLLLEILFFAPSKRIPQVIQDVDRASRDLNLLSQLLSLVEAEVFSAPRLKALKTALETQGVPPSKQIQRLRILVELLDSRRNPLFIPLALLLLLGRQLAYAIEAWRRACGPAVPRWLDVVGEVEALVSVAGYAYEHPGNCVPEVLDPAQGPVLEAEGLGHPLLPEERCVVNDVSLAADGKRQVLIISGSNMSGKSTLLRSVGINVVLALAGAPVRARRMRLVPMAVGASIRIQDSLMEGSSRFYAEITRLRGILDAASDSLPVLFLLDEILHGTNSHDRRIGAEAVVRALVRRGALGFVTTHDLALAEIAHAPPPQELPALNMHFEDQLENGRIVFDYHLRPGVVKKSNALALMREVGLEV